jgi:hypothetical protein
VIKTKATLTTPQMHAYLGALDNKGLVYQFVVVSDHNQFIDLELRIDYSAESGTVIRLHNDGTWTATTDVVVGERA